MAFHPSLWARSLRGPTACGVAHSVAHHVCRCRNRGMTIARLDRVLPCSVLACWTAILLVVVVLVVVVVLPLLTLLLLAAGSAGAGSAGSAGAGAGSAGAGSVSAGAGSVSAGAGSPAADLLHTASVPYAGMRLYLAHLVMRCKRRLSQVPGPNKQAAGCRCLKQKRLDSLPRQAGGAPEEEPPATHRAFLTKLITRLSCLLVGSILGRQGRPTYRHSLARNPAPQSSLCPRPSHLQPPYITLVPSPIASLLSITRPSRRPSHLQPASIPSIPFIALSYFLEGTISHYFPP